MIASLDALGFSPAVMQSNNDFGVASTFCVNAHGWPVPFSGCGSTVRAMTMVLADGTVVTCSRTENVDLFRHSMGGYGLFGVITELELDMQPNALLTPRFEEMSGAEIGGRHLNGGIGGQLLCESPGIGLEFQAKAAYAKVIAGAVAATAPAQLVIRSVVSGLDAAVLGGIPGVAVIGERGDGFEIETPRYDRFTRILADIARQGGTIREIAGNDEIMVSVTVREGVDADVQHGAVILRMKRDGVPGERLLVNVRMPELARFLNTYPLGEPGLEHAFDY